MIKMMPVTYCDKCGAVVNPEVSFDNMDFCIECYAELRKMLMNWIRPIEPLNEEIEIEIPPFMEQKLDEEEHQTISQIKAKPNKNGSKKKVKISKCTSQRKPIDWDKACALKLAGRSNAWIADELGINPGTVNVCIYKKLEEYKARKEAEEEEAKRRIVE